jgi:AcrR family transcriptional regulator
MSVPHRDPASARLVDIATELAIDAGPAALTARALAAEANASPSAVNYHFGGRDGLLAEVHRGLCARRTAWRIERLASLDRAAGTPIWAFMLASAFELGVTRRGETLALAEFEALAQPEQATLSAAVWAEHEAQRAFWLTAAERLGQGGDAAQLWLHFAPAATRFALLDDAHGALTWLAPSMLRLAERLAGAAVAPAPTPPWLAEAEAPGSLPERPAGAQRLIAAAQEIIGRQGLHAVTLRSVAEAAGLSLASTTYFFETKAEIVLAAFTQLRDRISAQALASGRHELAGSSQVVVSEDGEMRWEIGAMQALILAGARNPDLRPVALSLRRLSGQTSAALLAQYASVPCDRLDAFVYSTFGMGLQDHLVHLPPKARRAAMDGAVARVGSLAFGMPDA